MAKADGMMKCNLGQTEKYVRLVLGVVLFAFGLYFEHHFSGTVGQVLLGLSLALLLTAALNWCPLLSLKARLSRPPAAPVDEQPAAPPTEE